jgi:hypothetical protein
VQSLSVKLRRHALRSQRRSVVPGLAKPERACPRSGVTKLHCHLRISRSEYNDPILSLAGDGWWRTLLCPWRLSGRGWQCTWESESVEDDAWDVIGHSIFSMLFEQDVVIDPVSRLDGDISLAILADSDCEPWTMSVPGTIGIRTKGVEPAATVILR